MIVLYKGSRGRGKTLSMVKDALGFYQNGYRILTNLEMNFGEHITSQEVLSLNKNSDLYNCVLVLDELQLFFDSRNFGSKENKDFSYFIQQIRKRNIIILGTTQYTASIELRFRQHIDVVACPHFDKYTKLCIVKYYDLTSLEDGLSYIKPVTLCFDAMPIFKLYNTNEMLR